MNIMKKTILIAALTAGFLAQPTRCLDFDWEKIALGALFTTIGFCLLGSFLGWFGKTKDNDINMRDNDIGINEKLLIYLKNLKNYNYDHLLGKENSEANDYDHLSTKEIAEIIKWNSGLRPDEFSYAIDKLKKLKNERVLEVLNYKFDGKENLLEFSKKLTNNVYINKDYEIIKVEPYVAMQLLYKQYGFSDDNQHELISQKERNDWISKNINNDELQDELKKYALPEKYFACIFYNKKALENILPSLMHYNDTSIYYIGKDTSELSNNTKIEQWIKTSGHKKIAVVKKYVCNIDETNHIFTEFINQPSDIPEIDPETAQELLSLETDLKFGNFLLKTPEEQHINIKYNVDSQKWTIINTGSLSFNTRSTLNQLINHLGSTQIKKHWMISTIEKCIKQEIANPQLEFEAAIEDLKKKETDTIISILNHNHKNLLRITREKGSLDGATKTMEYLYEEYNCIPHTTIN